MPTDIAGNVTPLARAGLAAKGLIYCLTAILASMAAFNINGTSTEDTGKSGVLNSIQELPAGNVLLGIIAVGLACYSLWRLAEAFTSTDKSDKANQFGKRFRYFFSAIAYGALSFIAIKMLFFSGGRAENGNRSRETASTLLDQPAGMWLAGAVALVFIGTGIYQIIYAFREKYRKHAGAAASDPTASKLLIAGKIGYISRGIVWLIIGWMFMKAARSHNANKAGDTSEAFGFLSSSYGPFILAGVAAGLFCYGVFCFVREKWERFG